MRRNRYNFDALQDQHLDAMIRLAYKQADALEAQRIADDCRASAEQPSAEEAAAAFASFEGKLRHLARQDARAARRRRLGHMLPRIVQAAACIVLLLGISAPIAIANVESFRVKVMEMLIDIQEDHAQLEMVETTTLPSMSPLHGQGTTIRYISRRALRLPTWAASLLQYILPAAMGAISALRSLPRMRRQTSTAKTRACPTPQSTAKTRSSSKRTIP